MSTAAPGAWISGEEFGEERQRLLREGKRDSSPEMRQLEERVHARDEALWSRYAGKLMKRYAGQWAAISLDGESVVLPTASEALAEATRRFGASNFAFGRLSEFPGHDTSRC